MGFETRASSAVDVLFRLLAGTGSRVPAAPRVSQLQHARQAGLLAAEAGAPAPLVTAALLHDIGHVVDPDAPSVAHEVRGAAFLARWFGPVVTEPVRLHVAAKRYIVSQAPDYVHRLSAPALETLAGEGGAMRRVEGEMFCDAPFADAAIMLRIWDDAAREPGRPAPSLRWFRPYLEASLAGRSRVRDRSG